MQKSDITQKIQEMRGITLKIRDLKSTTPRQRSTEKELIKYALSQNQNLNDHDLDELAHELLYTKDFFIQVGDKKVTSRELREDVAEVIENPISPTISTEWIKDAKDVINNMSEDSINALSQRQNFLEDIEDRQTQLHTMLYLYQTNALPSSKQIIEKIKERIAELEKIKTIVKKATKEPEQVILNPQTNEADKAKAKIYTGILDHIENNKHIPDKLKLKLEINQGVDFSYSLAEEIFNKHLSNTKNTNLDRISQLKARQRKNNLININTQQLRFDQETYRKMLEQQKQNQR